MKKALITGITGQDGSYLSEFLLEKGYKVHGIIRRSSTSSTSRIDHLSNNKHLILHYGDMSDSESIYRLVESIRPDEIYNLASQSHVGVSFEKPIYTFDANALGTIRILESIRNLGLQKKTKFYQASTSELFGNTKESPQNEVTPFSPVSPYAISKLAAYHSVCGYRKNYGIFACNGILFNHESPRRGETFLTRKVTRAVARIKLGMQDTLIIGNINSKRDWGHAKDYVRGMWKMLQKEVPSDYVLATGVSTSIKTFIKYAFSCANIELVWRGGGMEERGYVRDTNQCIVQISPRYFRPSDVTDLVGDASKARDHLGWKPEYNVFSLIEEMVLEDLSIQKSFSKRNTKRS